MRRRLYLMRHAEVSYVGERDPEAVRLTPRGLEQAAAAHRALRDVEQIADFAEWRGGRLDDLPADELEELFTGSLTIKDEKARFLGGESLGEALDRVLPAFARLVETEWHTALAVFHGGVNRILLSHALAGGRTYFGTFEQAPACINVLDLGDDVTWIVRTVNYIPYDPLHPARTTTMEHLWGELAAWLDERG